METLSLRESETILTDQLTRVPSYDIITALASRCRGNFSIEN
jgi:hypothetical protein